MLQYEYLIYCFVSLIEHVLLASLRDNLFSIWLVTLLGPALNYFWFSNVYLHAPLATLIVILIVVHLFSLLPGFHYFCPGTYLLNIIC